MFIITYLCTKYKIKNILKIKSNKCNSIKYVQKISHCSFEFYIFMISFHFKTFGGPKKGLFEWPIPGLIEIC